MRFVASNKKSALPFGFGVRIACECAELSAVKLAPVYRSTAAKPADTGVEC